MYLQHCLRAPKITEAPILSIIYYAERLAVTGILPSFLFTCVPYKPETMCGHLKVCNYKPFTLTDGVLSIPDNFDNCEATKVLALVAPSIVIELYSIQFTII